MAIKEPEKNVYLVIDNSMLSMITEFCCSENRQMKPRDLIDVVRNDLLEYLTIIQSYSCDNKIHTTDIVSAEYKPENGFLGKSGLPPSIINHCSGEIRQALQHWVSTKSEFDRLKSLPSINKKFIDIDSGLSDQDFSLIHLCLELTSNGMRVFLIANDQDLLQFSSWVRTQPSVKINSRIPHLLEGHSGIAFLEMIHRGCKFKSDKMERLLNFFMLQTALRLEDDSPKALSKRKGADILKQIALVIADFYESVKIKQQQRQLDELKS